MADRPELQTNGPRERIDPWPVLAEVREVLLRYGVLDPGRYAALEAGHIRVGAILGGVSGVCHLAQLDLARRGQGMTPEQVAVMASALSAAGTDGSTPARTLVTRTELRRSPGEPT